MHGKNLIKKFSMSPDELTRLTSEALGSTTLAELDTAIGKTVAERGGDRGIDLVVHAAERVNQVEIDHVNC